MPTGRHIAFARLACGDVDDAIEKVSFSVLAAEVLYILALAHAPLHQSYSTQCVCV